MKSVLLHTGGLVVSSVLALTVWLREEDTDKPRPTDVAVWSAHPEQVEAVSYESKTRSVRLEPKQDGVGRYYVTRYEKVEEERPANPHAHGPHGAAPLASASAAPASIAKPPEAKRSSESFVAVKAADDLVKKLAPLLAVRSLGKLDPKRAAEYGLDDPEGTLKVKVSGKEHVLAVGAQTPGGGERYAKYGASGEIFAVTNELTQILSFADSRLMERTLHGFDQEEVETIKVSKGPKTKSIVRVPGKKEAWADAATPTKADETFSNWLSKLDRVRVSEYVEKPATPPRAEDLVVRVDYASKSKPLGFVELYKTPSKDEYLARTEYVRWHVKVVASAVEQVDRDLSSVLK